MFCWVFADHVLSNLILGEFMVSIDNGLSRVRWRHCTRCKQCREIKDKQQYAGILRWFKSILKLALHGWKHKQLIK